jgi:hypothetical protein
MLRGVNVFNRLFSHSTITKHLSKASVATLLVLSVAQAGTAQTLPSVVSEKPFPVKSVAPKQTRPFTESMDNIVARDRLIKDWYRQRGLTKVRIKMPNPFKMIKPVDDGLVQHELGNFIPPAFRGMTPRANNQKQLATPKGAQAVGSTDETLPTLSRHFPGVSYNGWIPPDTNGAIGPNHFAEAVNGSFAVYNKTGTELVHVDLDSFFTFSFNGINYPRGYSFDPRIVYDRRSSRWFVVALEIDDQDANHMMLAVSRTSNPTGVWDKYGIEIGSSGYFTDYESLSVDDNGVYFGWTKFGSDISIGLGGTSKASLIAATPSLSTVHMVDGLANTFSTPQAALNYGSVAPTGKAWFVAPKSGFSGMFLYHWTWNGSNPPTIGSFEFTTPLADWPPDIVPSGTDPFLPLSTGDFRSQMAMVRNNRIWTSRTVGLDASGSSSNVDRSGAEWFEFDISNPNAPTMRQNGRVWDPSAEPRHYFYPALVVNGQGHVSMSFSGSKATEFVGIYTTRRLATDPLNTMGAVTQIIPGLSSYTVDFGSGRNRWGDYSYTSLDPTNDMTFWTIQERVSATNTWQTYISELLAPAPTMVNPAKSGLRGTHQIINVTGTGFYDPGAGFPNRLSVAITGGTTNGINNLVTTFNSATSVKLEFDVAANATFGARNIELTNPDGQKVTAVGGFTVIAAGTEPPELNGFAINNGDLTTLVQTVTLNNSYSGSPTQYIASEDPNFAGATWKTYSTAPSFTLSAGFALKTVYLKTRNANGESTVASDTITLTNEPGVSSMQINNGAATATSRVVTLNNVASNSPTDYLASESPSFSGATWKPYSTAPSFTLTTGDGVKTVYFKVRNLAGQSNTISDTINLVEASTVTTFAINNNAAKTGQRNVTLNNIATKSPTEYQASESSTFVGATWQPYSASPVFNLSAGDGTKTVYFKVRNAGGESNVVSDSIVLAALPVINAFSINDGAASTNVRSVSLDSTVANAVTHYIASEVSSFVSATWQPYTPNAPFQLSGGNGTKTVYFKVKNANGESSVVSDSISYVSKPEVISMGINQNRPTTDSRNVTLDNVTYYLPTDFMASESPSFTGASWQAYSTRPGFVLSAGNGLKTVYFKTRNAIGESNVVSDTITLGSGPTVTSFAINNGAASTTSPTVTLNNVCIGSPNSYQASLTSDFAGSIWSVYSTSPSFTLPATNGVQTVYFRVRNSAGGISPTVSDTINLAMKPVVNTLAINNGAATTTSGTVTLNNTASGSPAEYLASESASFAGATWKPYAAAPSFALSAGTGVKTIYFKTRNANGESAVKSDTITRN